MNIPSPRLAGMIAGVFAVRTFDAAMSVVSQLALPMETVAARLTVSALPLAGCIGTGLICWIYLRERQARWQHILTITLLSVGIVYGAFMMATPFMVTAPDMMVYGPMIIRGVVQILFSVIAIWIVAVLLKRSRNPFPPQPETSA